MAGWRCFENVGDAPGEGVADAISIGDGAAGLDGAFELLLQFGRVGLMDQVPETSGLARTSPAASMPVSSLMLGLANCRLKSGRWLKMTQGQRRVSPSRRASARRRRMNISRRAASLRKCSSQTPSSNSASGGRVELKRTKRLWAERAASRVNHCTGWGWAAVNLRLRRSKGAVLSRTGARDFFQSGDRAPIASQKD